MQKYLVKVLLVGILVALIGGCASFNKTKSPSAVESSAQNTAPSSNDLSISSTPAPESNTVRLVVPEGFTLARIGMRLEEMGFFTVEEFIEAAQNIDYSDFSLIAEQKYDPNRAIKLEGYLFPDTYEIYRTDSPESIIKKMLANTEKKIDTKMRADIVASGYNFDEILTIASIIEKEAYERSQVPVPQEMPKISSVLHNRLDTGTQIQCDVTVTYVIGVLDVFFEDGAETYKYFYNTYRCPALPAGAICNPGIDAIKAAIYPADTDYMFFLTDENKNFYYSKTYAEHLILVDKYLKKDKNSQG